MLAIVAVATAVTFGIAGWEMLRQEGAAEEQRERERLERQADRAVQAVERVISDMDAQLDASIATSDVEAVAQPGGLSLLFDQRSIRRVSPANLVFYPALPAQAEPPDVLFASRACDLDRAGGLHAASSVRLGASASYVWRHA